MIKSLLIVAFSLLLGFFAGYLFAIEKPALSAFFTVWAVVNLYHLLPPIQIKGIECEETE